MCKETASCCIRGEGEGAGLCVRWLGPECLMTNADMCYIKMTVMNGEV